MYIFMKDEIFHCSGPVATVLLRPTSTDVFATAYTRVPLRYLYRSVANVRLDDHSAGNSRLLVLVGRVTVGLMWFQSREGRAVVVFEVHSLVYATTTVNFCLQRDCLATIRLKLCSVTLALVITKTSKSAARVQEAIKYLQRKQVTLIICNILPDFDFLFLFRLSKNIY